MNLDAQLEKSIYRMALRLSRAELEFFRIAGDRLAEAGTFTASQAKKYLYSEKYYDDQFSDLNKIKRVLAAAHNDNIRDMYGLYNGVTTTVYEDGLSMSKETGQRLLPFEEYKQAFNPMLQEAVSGYEAMARSTAVNQAYRKTIGNFLGSMADDEDRINFPQAMRKAIRELTEQGISTIDYESGRRVRMDSAVRNALMTEYTEIIEGIERKLAVEIGADGWEISAHEHPAVDHADIQGHIFTDEEFEKLQNHEPAEDVEGETFQLDRAIGDWNCRHMVFPFLIDISEPSFSKEELEEIQARNEAGIEFHGKHYTLYEAEQLQRRYETEMRHERENINLYKQVRDTDPAMEHDYRRSGARLAGLREGYKELGETLAPHAMRAKWERSYVPKGSAGGRTLPTPPIPKQPEIRDGWTPQFFEKIDRIKDYNSPHNNVDTGLLDTMAKQEGYKDGQEFKNSVNEYIKTNQSMTRFDMNKVLEHWADDPIYKNDFEVSYPNESIYLKSRKGWENTIAGEKINMTVRERPIYGFVGNAQDIKNSTAIGYGESYIVFKDTVKTRSTFTLGNSSNEQGAFSTDVSAMFNKGRSIDRKTMSGAVYNSRIILNHDGERYMETQIWGSADIRKDVEKIVLGGTDIDFVRNNNVLFNQFKSKVGGVTIEDTAGNRL